MEKSTHRTRTAGGIVVNEQGEVAMVRRTGAVHWLFPKGKMDEGETDEQTARREIQEEAGLTNLSLLGEFEPYERPRMRKDGSPRDGEMKEIKMFLFKTPLGAVCNPSMEMEEARFVPLEDVVATVGNEHDRAWFLSVLPEVKHVCKEKR